MFYLILVTYAINVIKQRDRGKGNEFMKRKLINFREYYRHLKRLTPWFINNMPGKILITKKAPYFDM